MKVKEDNTLDRLNSILNSLNIKQFSVFSSKVYIDDDLFIKTKIHLKEIGKLPFNFYIRGSLITIGLTDNLHPISRLSIIKSRGVSIDKRIGNLDVITSDYKDFLVDFNVPIDANTVKLTGFNINEPIENCEELSLENCVINTNKLNCSDSMYLEYLTFNKNIEIKDCGSVFIIPEIDNSVKLSFKNIGLLDLDVRDSRIPKCDMTLTNIGTLRVNKTSSLRVIKKTTIVDTFYIPGMVPSDTNRFLNMEPPEKPYLSCRSIVFLGKDYFYSYPDIENIEKYVNLIGDK